VRQDRVDKSGRVTLRYLSRLYHIGIGREHTHQRVTLFVNNKDIRVVADDGKLLRARTLDPSRDYQPTGRPPGPGHVLSTGVRKSDAIRSIESFMQPSR
jgi:hypothetical protein